jgi:hypothetical protein
MIKRKFGEALLSKSPEGQVNEVLAKVVCHNIVGRDQRHPRTGAGHAAVQPDRWLGAGGIASLSDSYSGGSPVAVQ